MNTLQAIFNRKSTRAYTSAPVPEESLELILKAGMAAPVANANYDSLHLTVVRSEEMLQDLFAHTTEFVHKLGLDMNMNFGARTLIIVSATPDSGGNTNAGCIVENMVLAATDLGIESVIMGIVPAVIRASEEWVEKLSIPKSFSPVLSAVFGYAENEEDAKEHHITVNWV